MSKQDKQMSIEETFSALEGIIRQLESGETDLETSLKLYEQGTLLLSECQKKLKTAELKITELSGVSGQ
ncbi:exodeoxyribonuclease VII small subunit [Acetanaerobacterium elongatum]|uniref:Exodeoxyribonuclease 7 small subunit n=1 Tax=Acetanaerobacterium elongatum TaxID=258515 RepID=A0A1H0AQH9_9FIRM|nr:exodeoxyribonuclease VII small subunit [Acetanaerobacterium elongatum]SDN35639.1 Exodeoxyribonuclease VII small subunit [Acetanaerobacterium elongatum]